MVYNQFAIVYDQLMTHAPYDKWVDFTEKILQKKNVKPQSMLDLGCGTGEITIRLSKLQYPIIGIDYSIDMLSIAQEKANRNGVDIQWIEQDIRELSGFSDIDVCISYCDVMNYITNKKELESVFEHVFNCLTEEGIFLFDVHDLEYAKNELIHQTFAVVENELTYIWDCEPGEKEGEMIHFLTFFKKEDNHYIKFDECHQQQTYALPVYEDLLKNAGFSKITFYNDFHDEKTILSENRQRNFIIAEK